MNETIGGRIAKFRKAKSMTQEELAGRLGVSAQAVSKWETEVSHNKRYYNPRLRIMYF